MDIVRKFEELLKETFDVRDAIAVNSGTSALIATLWSLDLGKEKSPATEKYFSDEIITTPFTFQATINSILISNGIPIFADIDLKSKLIQIDEIINKININTKAILPVHLFGRVFNRTKLKEKINEKWIGEIRLLLDQIYYIEDACQAFLAKDADGYYAGTRGDAGCFSFYKTKNLSTFEGGAIIIPKESRLDEVKIRAITNQGQCGRFNHLYTGFNFRMSEPAASLGYHMLKNHRQGIEAEIGKYNENNGYYPTLAYQQPSFPENMKHGINCPIAESVVERIKNGLPV